ncbi:hypothetical protein JYU34_019675, partial [Plutella xylostella]
MPAMRKLSAQQTELLLSHMEQDAALARRRAADGLPLTKATYHQHWERLADRLNRAGAGRYTKTAKEWRLYWNNLKYKAKFKAAEKMKLLSGAGAAGGAGASLDTQLTGEECRILNILGNECVFPDPGGAGDAGGHAGGAGGDALADAGMFKDEPVAKKPRPDCFSQVKRCCVDLVKVHGRSITLFDDAAFRALLQLIPLPAAQRARISAQFVQELLDSDDASDAPHDDTHDDDDTRDM